MAGARLSMGTLHTSAIALDEPGAMTITSGMRFVLMRDTAL